MRRTIPSSSLRVRPGSSRSRSRNVCRNSRSTRIGVSAVTVADRGPPASVESSPKKSPGSTSPTFRPRRVTLPRPFSTTNSVSPSIPSSTIGSRGSNDSSSLWLASRFRCLVENPVNSGTAPRDCAFCRTVRRGSCSGSAPPSRPGPRPRMSAATWLMPRSLPRPDDAPPGGRTRMRRVRPPPQHAWSPPVVSMHMADDVRSRLEQLLGERIVVLDGAWGVLLQGWGLDEADFRGERFAGHGHDVKGDPDLLNLTRPDIVSSIHDAYFEAGADITTTNTFTATSIGQGDYLLQDAVRDMNVEGARLAKASAERHGGLVAGSIGPLNVTLSLSPKVDDPAFRTVDFDLVYASYAEQIAALRDGGADLLLIETIFDTLNAKAAVAAALDVAPELPRWISVTIVDKSGRTLSGQTVEAFWTSIEHADPAIVGVTCSLGAREMRPSVEALARVAPVPIASYPNAGLPNAFGGFDETPEITRALLGEFAAAGLVNLVGGCCGTTPDHIKMIKAAVADATPRSLPTLEDFTSFSGLEPFRITPETGFVLVGERPTITGSKRFARLIESGDFQAAVDVARDQVENGANMIDVNMDTDLIDGAQAMTRFLNLVATEPEIAKVPIMVDSSKWDVIEAGLK